MVEVRPRKAWGKSNPQSLSDAAGTGPGQQLLAEAAAGGPITTPPCTVLGTAPTVLATVTVDPRGNPTTHRFNSNGYLIAQTDALGQTTQFDRANGTNLLLSTTDPLGRVTSFSYDTNGNLATITDPAGNARIFTYEPTLNKLISITDPLGNLTSFEYDVQGNLLAITDPIQNTRPEAERLKIKIAYNQFGQPTSTTDPLGNVTQYQYNSQGDFTAIIDPLGNVTTRTYDAVSRLIAQTDPRGKTTRFAYDVLNRLTQIVDALNSVTSFTYDANDNLLSLTTTRGNITSHTYDSMNRLDTRADPLGRIESYRYDQNGNLVQFTDRKAQVTTLTYDPLNRRIRSTFADGTFTDFTYDPVGRLANIDDSFAGGIIQQYDLLDRLARETTPQGTITYTYDAAGNRTSMTIDGQEPVTYSYDENSRLTQILQGTNKVTITYDAFDRRTILVLSNGVSTEYQYDPASRLTALIYRNGGSVLGDLTYRYDAAGNRIAVGGSFASILLPDPVVTTTYDAANQQISFGNKTMSYDANGNLETITDVTATTAFTWDARNRLAVIASPTLSSSFQYDALGRRIQKVINGKTSQFSYDGLDIVQETVDTADTIFTRGLDLDEPLIRNGTDFYLTDALGSIVGLTDPTGVFLARYEYEPFGRTVVQGASSLNPFQYTARENEGIGVYYYRNRYYSSLLHRFISEDPIRIAGGDVNFYSYVRNSPTNWRDPWGLIWVTVGYDYHGTSNWLRWYFNRWATQIGKGMDPTLPGSDPEEFVDLTRTVIQEWQHDPHNPDRDREHYIGMKRRINQTYRRFVNPGPDKVLINNPDAPYYYQWDPWVPERTYNTFSKKDEDYGLYFTKPR